MAPIFSSNEPRDSREKRKEFVNDNEQRNKLPLHNAGTPHTLRRRPRLQRRFRGLFLLLTAAVLSYTLPLPWTTLKGSSFIKSIAYSADVPPLDLNATAAAEWQDNVWPIRAPNEPWDISTDFPHPRKLEYDVEEGTWMRLDVNPTSGDVAFDIVGDIYCLPGKEVREHIASGSGGSTQRLRARPVLLGVPHDSDPHFSPQGDKLIFRSDAELGVENLWVMKWTECEQMDVRKACSQDESEGEGKRNCRQWERALADALATQEADEDLLNSGFPEDDQRKKSRLIREGRLPAVRVTNETYRWVSDARFHPSENKVLATKWYTSSRSLGAGEGWVYDVPSIEELSSATVDPPPASQRHVEAGSGHRVVGRTMPRGWTVDQYGDQQIGPEQLIWKDETTIIYAKNAVDESNFQYSKDVHSGIYAIFSFDIATGKTQKLVDATPGGASRPEISRDGRTLAFVRRVRDKETLVLKDLETGTIHNIWDGLTYDLSTVSAPMGTYPSFAFSPSDDGVVIWAAGQIHFVPLTKNRLGERIGKDKPVVIKFTAHLEKRLAETLSHEFDLRYLETQPTQRVRALKELRVNEDGSKVIFQAAGVNYIQDLDKETTTEIPVYDKTKPHYAPSFIHAADQLVLQAQWSDIDYTTWELVDLDKSIVYPIAGLPRGKYVTAVIDDSLERMHTIAFVKVGGTILTGNVEVTANPGLYIADIFLPPPATSRSRLVRLKNVQFVPSEIDINDKFIKLQFINTHNDNKLLVQQSNRVFTIDFKKKERDSYQHKTIANGKMSQEIVIPGKKINWFNGPDFIGFVDFFNVYLAPGKSVRGAKDVWSKPAQATDGLVRLSLDGGHDITFSGDGNRIYWLLGPYLHWLDTAKLHQCNDDIKHDRLTFGLDCIKTIIEFREIKIEHSTDIARLKQEAHDFAPSSAAAYNNNEIVVIWNATLLTMATGKLEDDLVEKSVLVMKGGLINNIQTLDAFEPIQGATVIDAAGGYVIPGFVDVHAHWSGYSEQLPAKSWEMQTFLAYGVTTLHNPSSDNVDGAVERARVERGHTIGPRIFHTGSVIYGAGDAGLHQTIVDMEEARSALLRIKAEAGGAALSYKNYNQPSRAARQRLLKVARDVKMLCVPEGGMNYDWDLTYIMDGMTTVEHALPVPVLYDDVLTLFAKSGTGYTPTHVVNYGGAWGEQLVWATHDVPNDPKLRRFGRHDILQELTESTARPANSFALFNTSMSAANMVAKGLSVHIGAHGEPPIGLNYHAEMAFTAQGGLSNYQTLQAATSWAAKTLGLADSIGSLKPGLLADFLVYPPGTDLVNGVMGVDTRDIRYVVRGGRVWEAATMEEVWPVKGRKQVMPRINAD